jgi:hypothetical protein
MISTGVLPNKMVCGPNSPTHAYRKVLRILSATEKTSRDLIIMLLASIISSVTSKQRMISPRILETTCLQQSNTGLALVLHMK